MLNNKTQLKFSNFVQNVQQLMMLSKATSNGLEKMFQLLQLRTTHIFECEHTRHGHAVID